MSSRPNDAAIDEIVARCNGDIRGALEAELLELQAVMAHGRLAALGSNALH
jgi:hypothetical protein